MSKGTETRQTILEHALRQASLVGLAGLSIGELAGDLELSKSGLFAHFGSKEQLQIDVIEAAATRFVELVVAPALRRPRGEPRLRAFFEGWLGWATTYALPGGCIFISAAAELDDRPGLLRDALVKTQRDWIDTLAQAARLAVAEGHFRADLDTEQFAFEMYAVLLGCHHYYRLLRDPRSVERSRAAFEHLLSTAR